MERNATADSLRMTIFCRQGKWCACARLRKNGQCNVVSCTPLLIVNSHAALLSWNACEATDELSHARNSPRLKWCACMVQRKKKHATSPSVLNSSQQPRPHLSFVSSCQNADDLIEVITSLGLSSKLQRRTTHQSHVTTDLHLSLRRH